MLSNKQRPGLSRRANYGQSVPQTRPVQAFAPNEHRGYRPSAVNRWIGFGGSLAIYGLVLAGVFFTVTRIIPVKPPSALTVVDMHPEASQPQAPPEDKAVPQPVERKVSPPERAMVEPVDRILVPVMPAPEPVPVAAPRLADPAPRQQETAAQRIAPAPPAPQIASSGPDSWEGRVLAELNKHRQYPRAAVARRQQGVPYIRFVLDREGNVLSSRLERSSGFPELDRVAVALPRRASPLPKPPEDKPGNVLELVVPVEFFLR